MNSVSLNELSLENIGDWPVIMKSLVMWTLVLLLLLLGYMFSFKEQMTQLDALKDKEITLRQTMEKKQQLAVNLPLYKIQLVKMRKKFGTLLKQLPPKAEIPELLEDISRTGIRAGLNFQLFDPQPEIEHDFYIELPIKIVVDGTYHQLAQFISDVAGMRRIVTLHNFNIQFPTKSEAKKRLLRRINGRWPLIMTVTAKIYRYKTFSQA
jgi:type IV pilus assembly protein PilO